MPQDMFEAHFEKLRDVTAPLAARMRPQTLADYVGQEHLVGEGRALRRAIDAGELPSIILWGPPGSGKTTLAHLMAKANQAYFAQVSAVSAGVADLRKIIEEAKQRRLGQNQKTILFIDEIHRFNKGQQDTILPYVEDGTVTLIGATTENPSFEVISPLLSRARTYVLKGLTGEQMRTILDRAISDTERGIGTSNVILSDEAAAQIVNLASGDARIALNILELAARTTPPDKAGKRNVSVEAVEDAAQAKTLLYDRAGEQHYDIISALHKSLRGSDPDASLYWLGRMLEAGEDPLFVVRRLIRFASEDIGMADPQALVIAIAAQQAVHFVGMPECNVALAQCVVYLATAPKSNSLYTAYKRVQETISKNPIEPVPLHLRNAPTGLMKDLGYGKGYKYAHDFPGGFVKQQNLPDSLKNKRFYFPTDIGQEKIIAARLKNWFPEREEKIRE
ncbi:replication-associated recombination protein A [Dehalogenimonas etheniformans]|uniref:Replication-associated recombination protein A n=1 Tax=Dehalogenimonas etheniformans TaxID=1536648 RepID=A0A2P5P8L8_9CHLR|nr:replication-associated recombination protein A [Dehalogenimonas etheniformans]PPD58639.1 replication-associated recombination protein A [Dehalogenimonas etheniformans]QNT76591.1 replication-associated recombination protein A [Dehalogenimonas etheniformans]